MSTGTATATKGGSGTLVGAFVVFIVLVGMMVISNGWFSGVPDPDLEDTDQDRRIIELQVVWLDRERDEHAIDPWDDRAGERVISPNRDVTITYWIDGEQHAGTWGEDDRGLWKHQFAAAVGSHIRFLVEETSRGGFKQCHILQDEQMVNYQHRNDGGDCDLEWVVVESP